MSSYELALPSASQVSILRMNLRNWSFSSPGGIVVTKSSKEVFGNGQLGRPVAYSDLGELNFPDV